MIRRLLIFALAMLTLLGRPGARGAFDIPHGVAEAQGAHADDAHDAHDPVHLGHGCATHFCPCHVPTVATSSWARAEIRPLGNATLLELEPPARNPRRGVRFGIFRPPTS